MSVSELMAPAVGRARQRALGQAWVPVAGVLLGAGWGSNQFTPMLPVYHAHLGLSTATLEAMFGAYAAGLIPGLLVAGRWSDRHGRRGVGLAAAGLSLLSSVSLIAGGHALALLFVGRLLAGLGSGAAFGVGTAWLRETSLPPFGDAGHGTIARRAAIAMTAGFAFGPLAAGVLAQWAPAVTIVPYVPHVVLMVMVLLGLVGVPETIKPRSDERPAVRLPRASAWRFRRVVVPMAPWMFVAPAVAFALLPNIVGTDQATDGIAVTAGITALTALAGVLIQPVARRLEDGSRGHAGAALGLLVLACGLAFGALTADTRELWLLVPCAIVFGAAYGLCLVAGLLEVQHLAPEGAVAGLTATFYAFSYIGFAAPFVLALAANAASYSVLLLITCVLATLTAGFVRWAGEVDGEGRAEEVVR
jgi:predicted MFS family arabinose efflux permease